MSLTLPSHAKINLFLRVLGRRPDGYHEVETAMLPIGLADTMEFEELQTPRIELTCDDPSLPTDQRNLVRRAAELLQQRHAPARGARITLHKKIPIGAGLGGGSSNGVTALVGLNRLWSLGLPDDNLEHLASEFGSDTAFFVRCRPAMSRGRGERLEPLPFPHTLHLLLLNFGFGSATAWAYKNFEFGMRNGESKSVEIRNAPHELQTSLLPFSFLHSQFFLQNDLERPVFQKFPILALAKDFLIAQPEVLGAMMCGSGSSMMAVVPSEANGRDLEKAARKKFSPSLWTWVGKSVPSADQA